MPALCAGGAAQQQRARSAVPRSSGSRAAAPGAQRPPRRRQQHAVGNVGPQAHARACLARGTAAAEPAAAGAPAPQAAANMLALMQAWGQLSARLQQQQGQQQQQSAGAAAGGSAGADADAAAAELILSALKLAVRSLSRMPAAGDGAGAAGPAEASGAHAAPAVQRSLALAAALAELHAAGLPLDAACIAAGIVAEPVDCGALHARTVHAKLGPEVAGLVHDVLAVRHAPERVQTYEDAACSALRTWLLGAYDTRAAAIEVVWRWLDLAGPLARGAPQPRHVQQLLGLEALSIFAPLGHALGLGVCATGLEDAAFKVLFPSSYASTARQVLPLSPAAAAQLAAAEAALRDAAAADAAFLELAAGVRLLGRTKSLYSIMRKLLRLQDPAAGARRLGELYDLLGLRAVVLPRPDLPAAQAEAAAERACYRLLELAQQLWPPLPGRSKDYIAAPKPNGYQSLHATLQLPQPPLQAGAPAGGGSSSSSNDSSDSSGAVALRYLELQVRTAAMHAAAEGGDAAHAGYKGRLERSQVRHLQQWTAQLQRWLAAPQQQQQLLLAAAASAASSSADAADSSSTVMFPAGPEATDMSCSSDSDDASSISSSSSASTSASSSSSTPSQPVAAPGPQLQQPGAPHQPAAAAAAAAALFRHLDLDGDGALSLYELSVLLGELQELRAPGPQPLRQGAHAETYAQQLLEALDSNGDGLVSLAEFLAFYMTALGHGSSSSSSASSSSSGGGGGGGGGGSNASSAGSTSGAAATPGAALRALRSASAGRAPPAVGLTSGASGAAHSSSCGGSAFGTSLLQRPPGVAAPRRTHAVPCSYSAAPGSSSSSSGLHGSRRRSVGSWRCHALSPGGAVAHTAVSSSDEAGSLDGSSGPDLGQQRASAAAAAAADAAAADGMRPSPSSSEPAQRQRSRSSRSTNGSGAAASTAAAAGQQQQQLLPPVLGLPRVVQKRRQAPLSPPPPLQPAPSSAQASAQQQQQQQQQQLSELELELSYEEEEQQLRRELRQQQQQLPTLLEDAASGITPCYVLVPAPPQRANGGPANGHGIGAAVDSLLPPGQQQHRQPPQPPQQPQPPPPAAPLPRVSMCDRLGRELPELEVPCLGPLLVTNAPRIFAAADVTLDAQTAGYDRLALTLELVKPPGCEAPVLQARNVSRVVRGRFDAATVLVNGQPLLPAHGPALELAPGDTLELGETGVVLVVRRRARPVTQPALAALRLCCDAYASRHLQLQLPVDEAAQQLLAQQQGEGLQEQQDAWQQEQEQQPEQPGGAGTSAAAAGSSSSSSGGGSGGGGSSWSSAAISADTLGAQLRSVSRLVRSNPRAAEEQLAQMASAHPGAAGPWFLWAQLAASSKRPWMARVLYRAAAVCQQQQVLRLAAGDAAAAAAGEPPQPGEEDAPPAAAAAATAAGEAAPAAGAPPAGQQGAGAASASASAAAAASQSDAAFSLSSRLVQVARAWGRLEWDARLFGPARRLWRLAANEAFRFPYEVAARSGGGVLHSWASAEFERDNTLNARVVIGEALRKCPRDAAVAVLAGSIEAAAGEVNSARSLFLRAYQLNKADKQLYMAWPRMEGSVGNIERARLLFQAGLSLYPNNIKILNLYACFEEAQGNLGLARELHRMALGIDGASATSMHNRVSWAGLELRDGQPGVARELLREGLDAHPNFAGALLLMAKLEQQDGRLQLAEAYARRAQRASSAFSVAAMRQLASIYAARGDAGLSSNLSRHAGASERMRAAKSAGLAHGSDAWGAFFAGTQEQEDRELIRAARQRKRELGLIRPWHRSGRGGGGGGGAGPSARPAAAQAGEPAQRRRPRHRHAAAAVQQAQPGPAADGVEGFDFAAAVAKLPEPLQQP